MYLDSSNVGTLVSTVGLAQADRATAVAMTARFRQMDKNAIKWTRLSCGKFRNNEVRLQLHALAYNLANFSGRWPCRRRSSTGR